MAARAWSVIARVTLMMSSATKARARRSVSITMRLAEERVEHAVRPALVVVARHGNAHAAA